MAYPPTIADFKAQFNRAFVYGPGLDQVQDADIQNALNMAAIDFNQSVWINAQETTIAFLYVAAHFLVRNVQAAGGLSSVNYGSGVNSQGSGVTESKGVGQVNIGYAVPDFVRQDPILSQFMATDFGQLFLQLFLPRRVGNTYAVTGIIPANAGFGGNIAPLEITTASLPNGTHAVAYSQQLAAVGGLVPLNWSVVTGTLPVGLTLTASGLIAGTPTTPGTYTFRVQVLDGQANTQASNYTVTIA